MAQYMLGRRERECRLLLRGDSAGRLALWMLPEVSDARMRLVRQESFERLPVLEPKTCSSLSDLWSRMEPQGLIDEIVSRQGLICEIFDEIRSSMHNSSMVCFTTCFYNHD